MLFFTDSGEDCKMEFLFGFTRSAGNSKAFSGLPRF